MTSFIFLFKVYKNPAGFVRICLIPLFPKQVFNRACKGKGKKVKNGLDLINEAIDKVQKICFIKSIINPFILPVYHMNT
jgi:hypothetical protein